MFLPTAVFKKVLNFYSRLGGNIGKIGFNNIVFLSEKRHADRNISLAYYMRENKAYKNYTTPNDINEILDIYFQCCSVSINTENCLTSFINPNSHPIDFSKL